MNKIVRAKKYNQKGTVHVSCTINKIARATEKHVRILNQLVHATGKWSCVMNKIVNGTDKIAYVTNKIIRRTGKRSNATIR